MHGSMRNNVTGPAKQFISQYRDEAYAKAREAQLTALKERRGQLAAFYGVVAEKIKEVTAGPGQRNRKFEISPARTEGRH